MELLEPVFLDSSMKEIYIADAYKSLIWTDRYYECGDFELTLPPTSAVMSIISSAAYVKLSQSARYMIVEDIKLETNPVDGDDLVITGRSYESILDRRIIWPGIVHAGDLDSLLYTIVYDNFISPTDTDRQISMNWSYEPAADPIWNEYLETQFTSGENAYDALVSICKTYEIGFRFLMSPSTGVHTLEVYNGIDRSYDQTSVPVVEFSNQFDNLLSSVYIETDRFVKNFAYVAGETGVENARVAIEVYTDVNPDTGLARRELYLEPGISRSTPDGQLTEVEYLAQLEQKGYDELAKKVYVQAFDGEVAADYYEYNQDYFMGDILQIADAYGHTVKSRVVEMIFSQDREGVKIYPTFITVGQS